MKYRSQNIFAERKTICGKVSKVWPTGEVINIVVMELLQLDRLSSSFLIYEWHK